MTTRWATLLVGCLAVVAACGGDGSDAVPASSANVDPTASAPQAPAAGNDTTTLEPVAGSPASAEQPTQQPGETVGETLGEAVGETVTTNTEAPVVVPGPTVPAQLDDEADFGTGVIASIESIEAVDVEGRAPGERSGPGVLVSVRIENTSTRPISLDYALVDLIDRDGASAIPVEMATSRRLSGDLQPGASAVGHYHYFVPAELRQSATITINYAAGVPTALFTGALPDV